MKLWAVTGQEAPVKYVVKCYKKGFLEPFQLLPFGSFVPFCYVTYNVSIFHLLYSPAFCLYFTFQSQLMFESLCILVTAVFSFMPFCSHSASFLHWSRCLSLFGCVSLPVLFPSPPVGLFVTVSCSYLYPLHSLYQEYLVSPCPWSCPWSYPASGECVSLLHVSLRFLVWGLFIPVQPQFIFLCF